MKTPEKIPVGVIVGRFQVHKLHSAHRALINSVFEQHNKVIIFLGVSQVTPSRRNPLDFKSREQMLRDYYPTVTILPIRDVSTDEEWSHNLDHLIRIAEPHGGVVLYGSRDSFLNHYTGRFAVVELESNTHVSGTEIRKNVSDNWFRSPDFRAGVIYATSNCFKHVYPTVDIALLRNNNSEVLLAKKPNSHLYRFVGGFVDPTDVDFMEAAKRELREETGLESGNYRYVTSMRVDDWRYRSEEDKIITTFFAADYIFGAMEAKDDISELTWVNRWAFDSAGIEPSHAELWTALMQFLKRTPNENEKEHSTADRLI